LTRFHAWAAAAAVVTGFPAQTDLLEEAAAAAVPISTMVLSLLAVLAHRARATRAVVEIPEQDRLLLIHAAAAAVAAHLLLAEMRAEQDLLQLEQTEEMERHTASAAPAQPTAAAAVVVDMEVALQEREALVAAVAEETTSLRMQLLAQSIPAVEAEATDLPMLPTEAAAES
jgi:hypothetical protein